MLQDSVRYSSALRQPDGSDFRSTSRLNDMSQGQLLVDSQYTRLALCEEPPSLADLMRPNSTTSFLL